MIRILHSNRRSHGGGRAAFAGLVLLACSTARAQDPSGGAPGDWLSRYTSARSVGLGGAFVASADAALGVLWNPAGLSQLDQDEVLLESARLFEDTSIQSLGFAVPGRWLPSLGLSIVALRSGEFDRTNELNESLGTFQNGETAFLFSASKNLSPRLALGANLKLVRQNVEDFSASGFGADVGGILTLTRNLRLGASILNVGGPNLMLRQTQESYPTELRGGFALQVLGGRALLSAEMDRTAGVPVRLHAGTEYWIQRALALRVGYDDQNATGGLSYRIAPQVQLDYGVSDHALGLTHRLGLAYRFSGFFASSVALPEVFSPTGEQSTTKIRLQAHTKADADSWSLLIVDKSDQVVRRFGGPGVPPPHLVWDGKDETGLPLADGTYRYQLVVSDRDGRQLSAQTRIVQISTGGPQGSVPVIVQ